MLRIIALAALGLLSGCGGESEFIGTWEDDVNGKKVTITIQEDNRVQVLAGEKLNRGVWIKDNDSLSIYRDEPEVTLKINDGTLVVTEGEDSFTLSRME